LVALYLFIEHSTSEVKELCHRWSARLTTLISCMHCIVLLKKAIEIKILIDCTICFLPINMFKMNRANWKVKQTDTNSLAFSNNARNGKNLLLSLTLQRNTTF
jgi:hypothetical protein